MTSAYLILVRPEIVVKIVVINGADAIKIVFNKPTVDANILCSTEDTSHCVNLIEVALAVKANKKYKPKIR